MATPPDLKITITEIPPNTRLMEPASKLHEIWGGPTMPVRATYAELVELLALDAMKLAQREGWTLLPPPEACPPTSETASPEPRGPATASDCSNPNGQPQPVACSLPVLQSETDTALQEPRGTTQAELEIIVAEETARPRQTEAERQAVDRVLGIG